MVSNTKKGGLNALFESFDKKDFNDPGKKKTFFNSLDKFHAKIPVYKLLEIENYFLNPRFSDSFPEMFINRRIDEFNAIISKQLPGNQLASRYNFTQWLNTLSLAKCQNIITETSINDLARFAKEIPPASSIYESIIASLNSRLYCDWFDWLDKFYAKNDFITELVFESVRNDLHQILFNFDTRYSFLPYFKKILIYRYFNVKPEESKDEPDPSTDNLDVLDSFITICLLLFVRLPSKPHHKLVFWHENMHYVKESDDPRKNIKAIDHDRFFMENGSCNLDELWELSLEEINVKYSKLNESSEHKLYFSSDGAEDDLTCEFRPFIKVLETLFNKVYPEHEYEFLTTKNPDKIVGEMILDDYLWKNEGARYSVPEIRLLAARWNNRIKELFKEIIVNGGAYADLLQS